MKLHHGVFVVVFASSSMVLAAQSPSVAGGASIKADNVERLADDTLKATGNVEVSGDGFHLRANSVELRRIAGSSGLSVELVARGDVVLTRGRDRLVLESLQFNPSTGTGVFQLPQSQR